MYELARRGERPAMEEEKWPFEAQGKRVASDPSLRELRVNQWPAEDKAETTEKRLNRRDRNKRREVEGVPARMETVERIAEVWLRTLEKSGYVAPRGKATAEEKLRRMLRRFALEESDAEVFLGMVRKVLWKMEEGAKK